MLSYESSASINASVESMWRVLSDVLRWNEWTPTVTRVEALDHAELGVGRRFKVFQPRLRPTVWTVTALEPPLSFTWKSRSPGLVMIAAHTLRPSTTGQTEISLTFAFQGVLGVAVGKLYRSLIENYLATEAASLRKRTETLAGVSPNAT